MLVRALLWLTIACLLADARRIKRTGLGLFHSKKPHQYPVWKVHKYTGLHLQPLVPQSQGLPPLEGPAPSIVDVPDYSYSGVGSEEEEDSPPSALSSILNLIQLFPGGLSGLLSVSSASSARNEKAEDRLDLLGVKQDILLSALANKKKLLASAANGVLKVKQAKKGLLKDLLLGPPHFKPIKSGIFHQVPLFYPQRPGLLSRLPLIGSFFGDGHVLELPEVLLPNVPQLVGVGEAPRLPLLNIPGRYSFPLKSGSYVKVNVPGLVPVPPRVPATSYGVPAEPIPVPEAPSYEPPQEYLEPSTPSPTTEGYPLPAPAPVETFPYPPELPELPVVAHYPQIVPSHPVRPIFSYSHQTYHPENSYYPQSGHYEPKHKSPSRSAEDKADNDEVLEEYDQTEAQKREEAEEALLSEKGSLHNDDVQNIEIKELEDVSR